MPYRIEITDVAEMELQDILFWFIARSPEQAGRWQQGLEHAIGSLRELPTRCPLAPENDAFEVEIRQLLYGRYRVLFTCVDEDGDGRQETVRILHVRHSARRRLNESGVEEKETP